MLGLGCCMGFSLVVASGGSCLVAVRWLLTAVASLVVEQRWVWLSSCSCHCTGLSWPEAHGIFPDQRLNPGLPHWQVDSLPLSHQGSPCSLDLFLFSGDHFG